MQTIILILCAFREKKFSSYYIYSLYTYMNEMKYKNTDKLYCVIKYLCIFFSKNIIKIIYKIDINRILCSMRKMIAQFTKLRRLFVLPSRVSRQNPILRRLHFIKNPFSGQADSSGRQYNRG